MTGNGYVGDDGHRYRLLRAITRRSSLLWALAVLTFGVGDVVTTVAGLGLGAVESSLLGERVLRVAGVPGMVAWKAGALVLFAAIAARVPREWQVGVPLGVVLSGTAVTAWNLLVVAALL